MSPSLTCWLRFLIRIVLPPKKAILKNRCRVRPYSPWKLLWNVNRNCTLRLQLLGKCGRNPDSHCGRMSSTILEESLWTGAPHSTRRARTVRLSYSLFNTISRKWEFWVWELFHSAQTIKTGWVCEKQNPAVTGDCNIDCHWVKGRTILLGCVNGFFHQVSCSVEGTKGRLFDEERRTQSYAGRHLVKYPWKWDTIRE